jgi:hypothetical protein
VVKLYYNLINVFILTIGVFVTSCKAKQNEPIEKIDQKIHFYIKNRNKKDVSVLIKPEYTNEFYNQHRDNEKIGWVVLTIPAALNNFTSADIEFEVSVEQLGNFDYYSITGETNTLTPTGTCYNLEMGKCYKIEFTNNLFGTDCVGTEIKNIALATEETFTVLPAKKVIFSPRVGVPRTPKRPSEILTRNQ